MQIFYNFRMYYLRKFGKWRQVVVLWRLWSWLSHVLLNSTDEWSTRRRLALWAVCSTFWTTINQECHLYYKYFNYHLFFQKNIRLINLMYFYTKIIIIIIIFIIKIVYFCLLCFSFISNNYIIILILLSMHRKRIKKL